jgi:DNA-binding transcriptional LysR family regulator
VDLAELRVFAAVAAERSFSRAALRVGRTQPAVSQAIRRLEDELSEQLFDRTTKEARLTPAGELLLDYAGRLERLAQEAESSIRELRDLMRGRVLIGTNEGGVHALLPLIERFREHHGQIVVDVRRVHSRQIPAEVSEGSLDFGALSYKPGKSDLEWLPLGEDEMVMLVASDHPLAQRKRISMAEAGRQIVIAHNDPSPARERVIRLYEERHLLLNMMISLPSLDAIKRAVEMNLGVALLPRRCAVTEIKLGRLTAVPVSGVSMRRHLRLVHRKTSTLSPAARAFLDVASTYAIERDGRSRGNSAAQQSGGSSKARRGAGRSRPRPR